MVPTVRNVPIHLVWGDAELSEPLPGVPQSEGRNAKRRRGFHRKKQARRLVVSLPGDDVHGEKGRRSGVHCAACFLEF